MQFTKPTCYKGTLADFLKAGGVRTDRRGGGWQECCDRQAIAFHWMLLDSGKLERHGPCNCPK